MLESSEDRSHLLTEQRLPESMTLDAMTPEEIVGVMNDQDRRAVEAVVEVRSEVAKAIDLVTKALQRGGRLVYFGAGTSGRLGVLDASECPPTFRADPRQVQGVIAGGKEAMFVAQEGAEDSEETGARDVDAMDLSASDVAFGIATGGTTPYVRGALQRAHERGAGTIFLACVEKGPNQATADVEIRPLTGPEVLTGSTRLKAGTATKLVLNQVTTGTMVRLGKCYENLMVDLKATNAKLVDRATRIVSMLTGLGRDEARQLLQQADAHVKVAVVMHKLGVDAAAARQKLDAAHGHLRTAIEG